MVQCALNGDYTRADHPQVPVSLDELVADSVACWAAGAISVHLHPNRTDQIGTLAAPVHDAVVSAVRTAVPGLEISGSTAEGIDIGDATDRVAAVRAWRSPPDVVSLNLAEEGAFELGDALIDCGIGIEAGLFTLADADRLLDAPWVASVHRVLVEMIFEHHEQAAADSPGRSTRASPSLGVPVCGTATHVQPGRSSTLP